MFGITAAPPPTTPVYGAPGESSPEKRPGIRSECGEVTQVLSSPDAFVIFKKLESKEYVPVEVAQSEFKPILHSSARRKHSRAPRKTSRWNSTLRILGHGTAPELFLPQAPSETLAESAARFPTASTSSPTDAVWTSRGPRIAPIHADRAVFL